MAATQFRKQKTGSLGQKVGDNQVRRLVTVQELAEILRVPRSWLYERTRRNQIPHLKLGRYVRFEPEHVIASFKEKQKNEQKGVIAWVLLFIIAIGMCASGGPSAEAEEALSQRDRGSQLARANLILQLDDVENSFVLSPHGRYLAVRQKQFLGSSLKLYDLSANPPHPILVPNRGQISSAFTSDIPTVWLGTKAGKAFQFDLSNAKVMRSINVTSGRRLDEIVLSPDGQYLGWYGGSEEAGLFDLHAREATGSWKHVRMVLGHSIPRHIDFTPDGNFVVLPIHNPDDLFQLVIIP